MSGHLLFASFELLKHNASLDVGEAKVEAKVQKVLCPRIADTVGLIAQYAFMEFWSPRHDRASLSGSQQLCYAEREAPHICQGAKTIVVRSGEKCLSGVLYQEYSMGISDLSQLTYLTGSSIEMDTDYCLGTRSDSQSNLVRID